MKPSKFKVGDRVIGGAGRKGTVTQLALHEFYVFVKWDHSIMQEMAEVSALEKLIDEERANDKKVL